MRSSMLKMESPSGAIVKGFVFSRCTCFDEMKGINWLVEIGDEDDKREVLFIIA